MSSIDEKYQRNHHARHSEKRRRSSFHMHDPELIFRELNIKEGESFLDLGCGTGDYAIRVSIIAGESGMVYALDKSGELIGNLNKRAYAIKLKNLKAMECDITGQLPIEDNNIDITFIATVLHAIDIAENGNMLFSEIYRVLKPGGRLITIDCKKKDESFGPPMHMRLSPEKIINTAEQYNFKMNKSVDLGFNNMLQFISI